MTGELQVISINLVGVYALELKFISELPSSKVGHSETKIRV